jgi:hypothetical protein
LKVQVILLGQNLKPINDLSNRIIRIHGDFLVTRVVKTTLTTASPAIITVVMGTRPGMMTMTTTTTPASPETMMWIRQDSKATRLGEK